MESTQDHVNTGNFEKFNELSARLDKLRQVDGQLAKLKRRLNFERNPNINNPLVDCLFKNIITTQANIKKIEANMKDLESQIKVENAFDNLIKALDEQSQFINHFWENSKQAKSAQDYDNLLDEYDRIRKNFQDALNVIKIQQPGLDVSEIELAEHSKRMNIDLMATLTFSLRTKQNRDVHDLESKFEAARREFDKANVGQAQVARVMHHNLSTKNSEDISLYAKQMQGITPIEIFEKQMEIKTLLYELGHSLEVERRRINSYVEQKDIPKVKEINERIAEKLSLLEVIEKDINKIATQISYLIDERQKYFAIGDAKNLDKINQQILHQWKEMLLKVESLDDLRNDINTFINNLKHEQSQFRYHTNVGSLFQNSKPVQPPLPANSAKFAATNKNQAPPKTNANPAQTTKGADTLSLLERWKKITARDEEEEKKDTNVNAPSKRTYP